MFKVGDKVKCIPGEESTLFGHELIYGKIYTITNIISFCVFICLDGDETKTYNVDRFELVVSKKMPMATAYSGPLGYVPVDIVIKQPHKCSCVFRDLLMNGCKCGGI